MSVTVPLDRFGSVPGTIDLHVEVARALDAGDPPLFVTSGPGASATSHFPSEAPDGWLGLPGARDVVIVDRRGTGKSGLLRCKELQRVGIRGGTAAARKCAESLGAHRAFYTSRDSVEDLEAVRSALGAPTIALYGPHLGGTLALEYARRYPTRVERILLESPSSAGLLDPLYRPSLQAAPDVLRRLCDGSRCRSITDDFVGDFERLAARLEQRPLRGTLPDGHGRPRPVRVDGFDLFQLLAGVRLGQLRLPGAVRNALRGDPAPLLRAHVRNSFSYGSLTPRVVSWAAFAATLCEESELPWSSTTPIGQRITEGRARLAGLPPETFGPFGPRAALSSDVVEMCLTWPSASRPGGSEAPLPTVPTLVLVDDSSTGSPVSSARDIAARIPGTRVLVAHEALNPFGDFPTTCRGAVVHSFFAGDESWRTRRWCPGTHHRPWPSAPVPLALRELRVAGRRDRAARTAAAVRQTVADGKVELFARLTQTSPFERRNVVRVGGLRSGSYAWQVKRGELLLDQVSVVPGVRVTGRIAGILGPSARYRGRLRVSGRVAAHGALTIRGGFMRGRLGRRTLNAPFSLDMDRLLGGPPRSASVLGADE